MKFSAPKILSQNTKLKQNLKKLSYIGCFSACLLLAGCYQAEFEKHHAPIPAKLQKTMAKLGVNERDAIFIRIFKKEAELEVWKKTSIGKQILLKTYEICAWSGELGPKFQEGDRQAPEGFYKVTPAQMNPNSSFHLAFNLGFPNNFDRSHDRTGSFLMVHGACSSAGCYSMEDHQIEEIYALAREAFLGGQKQFQVHAFPFRMTAENMALFQDNEHMPFWRTLKRGYEHFELTGREPKVEACDGRYIFNARLLGDGEQFNAKKPCPEYKIPDKLKNTVDDKIIQDKILEDQIASQWTNDRERRHAELSANLKIEKERIQKFRDRGLAYSSHLKRRVNEIKTEFVQLGYLADGILPPPVIAEVTPKSESPVQAVQAAVATPVITNKASSPQPRANPRTNALSFVPQKQETREKTGFFSGITGSVKRATGFGDE